MNRRIINRKLAQQMEQGNLKPFYVKLIESIRREGSIVNEIYPPQVFESIDAEGINRDPNNPKRFYVMMAIKSNMGPAYYLEWGVPHQIVTTNRAYVPVYNMPPVGFSFEKDLRELKHVEPDIVNDIKEAGFERVYDQKDVAFFEAVITMLKRDASVGIAPIEQVRLFNAQYFKATMGGGTTDVVIDAWYRPDDDTTGTPYRVGVKTLLTAMKNRAVSLRVNSTTWLIPEQAYNLLATWDFTHAGTLAPFFFVTGSISEATNSATMLGYRFILTKKTVDITDGYKNEVPGPININALGAASEADIDSRSTNTTPNPAYTWMYLLPNEDMFGLNYEVQPDIYENIETYQNRPTYKMMYEQIMFLALGIGRSYFAAPIKAGN